MCIKERLVSLHFSLTVVFITWPNVSDMKSTNRLHVAVGRLTCRLQTVVICGENKKVSHDEQPRVSVGSLPHFDLYCHL